MPAKRRANGEGSIYETADGRWRGCATLAGATGAPIEKYFTGKSRADVAAKIAAAKVAEAKGLPAANDKITVADFLNSWLERTVKPSVRPKTYRSYEQMVRNHLAPGLGSTRLNRLTAQQFEQFLASKIASGSSASLTRYLRVVMRIALRDAMRFGLIAQNVAALAKPPAYQKRASLGFQPDEAARFLAACKGHRHEALFTSALGVGLRHGEALALRLEDLDLESGELHVNATLQRIDGRLTRTPTKSAAGRRTVPLPAFCVETLQGWLKLREQYRAFAGDQWREENYLFCSSIGTALWERNILRDFYSLLDAAKLPRRRIHDLRHCCVSLLGAQGVDLKTIAEIVGHSDTRLTQNIYQHSHVEAKRKAASAMDSVFRSTTARITANLPERKVQ